MSEGFLSRWSRLKRDSDGPSAREKAPDGHDSGLASTTTEPAAALSADKTAPSGPWSGRDPSHAPIDPGTLAREIQTSGEPGAAELPSIDSLLPSSDFRPFMQAGVPAGARNAALKKLFADPAFNVMDGLDTYIDDYSLPSPVPAAMLKGLMENHLMESAQNLIFADPQGADVDALAATADEQAMSPVPATGPRIAIVPDAPGGGEGADVLRVDAPGERPGKLPDASPAGSRTAVPAADAVKFASPGNKPLA